MVDRRTDGDFAALLLGSFLRLVGRPLLDETAGERPHADWLYREAPFCLLAHDGSADPVFTYANRAAQRRFEGSWDEMTAMPSRLSAETGDRAERQRALDAVARHGFVENYRGVRVSRSGRRFLIEAATVWELQDAAGARHGQAALFRRWRDLP